MTRNPDQIRRIKSAVSDVDIYWYADTSTKEIRRHLQRGTSRAIEVVWPHKHEVREIYWWIAENWAKPNLVVFHYPMQHDNMPLTGFPMKFELQGGWTIPQSDIIYLKNGPLASEGLHTILVLANLGWRRILELGKQIAPIFSIIGVLVTIIVKAPELRAALARLANTT